MGVCGGTLVGAGCEERGVGGGGLVGKSVRRGAEKGSKWASGCRSSLRPPPSLFQRSGEPLGWYQVLKEANNGVVQGASWKE